MCRHNLTGYISPRMEANTDFFYLVGLEYYLLKYDGYQLATAEKGGNFTPLYNNKINVASNIINYKLITLLSGKSFQQWFIAEN